MPPRATGPATSNHRQHWVVELWSVAACYYPEARQIRPPPPAPLPSLDGDLQPQMQSRDQDKLTR